MKNTINLKRHFDSVSYVFSIQASVFICCIASEYLPGLCKTTRQEVEEEESVLSSGAVRLNAI